MVDAPKKPENDTKSHLDHLADLHRMSRTAGLGSSEYSAVNVAAVVAVMIGAASGLALVSPLFLFLPLVGVIIASVAIKQVVGSNGTQTGLPLAILALVLSFGLAGFTGLKYFADVRQVKADEAALNGLMEKFGGLVSQKKYDDAYALTDARFQEQFKRAEFETVFDGLSSSPNFGNIKGFRTNKIFQIEADPETGLRMAMGYIFLDFEKKSDDSIFRTEARYRYSGDAWKIYALPKLFAPKAPPGGGAGGGAAPGGAPTGPAGPPAS